MDHVTQLERNLEELSAALQSLGKCDHVNAMLEIVRRPGWTTPAELLLVDAMVDAAATQARQIEEVLGRLVAASKQVELNPQPLPPG